MVVLSNFLAPQEGIRHEEPSTTVFISDREVGKGTLYITESTLSWVNSSTQEGFSLEYLHISLHAISLNRQLYPQPCLYIMIDAKVDWPDVQLNQNNDNSSGEEDDDSEAPFTEIRFAPDNTNSLQTMFQAMNQCQALHPDPQDSFSDAEEDIYEDAEEDDLEYSEAGAGDAPYIIPEEMGGHNGTEVEESMDVESGQFEDAEEDP